MIEVIFYRRENCELCDAVIDDLITVRQEYEYKLNVVQIDNQPDLESEFGEFIPALKIGPYLLKSPFTIDDLRVTLSAAQDRDKHIENIIEPIKGDKTAYQWGKSDDFSHWFSKHYMVLFNLVVFIYFGMAFLAPVLMKVGAVQPAKVIYKVYGFVCHQLAYRSIFLFGEQFVYPRAAAGVDGLLTFHEATGMGEGNTVQEMFAARKYVGDEIVGYKIALCQRCLSIYGSILLFGLIFSLTGKKLPPLPFWIWILIGILPIAFDGLSQILSQPPFNLWHFRESTPFFRILTGFLFGFFTAWFGYPLVEESMRDTRKLLEYKKERIRRTDGIGKDNP